MADANDKPVDGAYALGIEMLDRGEPPATVEKKLIEMGVTAEGAKKIIASYSAASSQAASADGKTEMQFGAVVAGGGVVVLLVSGIGSLVGWLGVLGGSFNFYRGWSKRRSTS